jgi:hypothetical protein
MKEDFEKVNGYTLAVKLTLDSTSGYYSSGKQELTRIFNFQAGQVTTIARDWLHQDRGSESGGSSATALQMSVQNFGDIEAQGELEIMHAKLVELGGKPPALADILPGNIGKKPQSFPRPAAVTP